MKIDQSGAADCGWSDQGTLPLVEDLIAGSDMYSVMLK